MELILLALVVLICFLYVKHNNIYSYWKLRNITSLPVLPIVGSYVGSITMKEHIGQEMRNIYEEYPNEKYVGGFRGTTPELIVRDPEVVKHIFSKDFNYFIDRGLRRNVKDNDVLGSHLFHMNGEKWRALRQKLTPTFTSSKMRKMFHLIVECGQVLDESIKDKLTKGNEIDVKEQTAKYTTDTIGSCAFGLQMNSLRDEDSVFRRMGKKFFETSKFNNISRFLASAFPDAFRMFNIKIHSDQTDIEEFYFDLVKKLFSSRTGTAHKRHDFVDLMLELKEMGSIDLNNVDDADQKKMDITDELLTAQLFVFFAAGFETSSTTMSYALRELAFNPEVQKKLQRDIDTVLRKHGGQLTYDAVQEMEYLDMVIDETLRKYPPVPTLSRVCTSPYKLPGTNIDIEKGVKMLIPIYGMHHDPTHFPEPEKFKPERFSKKTGNTHHPFSYLPFGEGPRICIGSRFGKLQATMGLIVFMRKYTVEVCSNTQTKLDIDPMAIVFAIAGGITLRIKPRDDDNVKNE